MLCRRIILATRDLQQSLEHSTEESWGTKLWWEQYVGLEGIAIGISHFEASAPGKVIYEKLGLSAQHVADEVLRLLQRRKPL